MRPAAFPSLSLQRDRNQVLARTRSEVPLVNSSPARTHDCFCVSCFFTRDLANITFFFFSLFRNFKCFPVVSFAALSSGVGAGCVAGRNRVSCCSARNRRDPQLQSVLDCLLLNMYLCTRTHTHTESCSVCDTSWASPGTCRP
ncbi:UNVERIFIED_CONTAM: hypothetical protein K2H54_070999 [Gekko kuhli]